MRVIKYDLASKFESVKDEILIELQNENLKIKKELDIVKEELSSKGKIIDELRTELDQIRTDKNETVDIGIEKEKVEEVERDCAELQQYIRRNNIEIAGIPDSVKQQELEKKVIEIAKAVDIAITPNEIEACHRLHQNRNQRGPKRTIVRFVNRKLAENLIKKGKEFGKREIFEKANLPTKIYINNNLCSYYRFLWGKVKSLYNRHAIHSFWVFNGTINLRFNDGTDEVMKVTHLNDLIDSFPDHNDLFVSDDES